MNELAKKKCIPCSGEIPPFTEEEINNFLTKVKSWSCKKNDDNNFYLTKDFKFKNFEESLNFINKVSEVAKTEKHHPDLKISWSYGKITIFTHDIKGRAESDFILAAKIDDISA